MIRTARTILFVLAFSLPVAAQDHLYAPETNLEKAELARLETATRSIDIAMYAFTDRYLAEAQAGLARRGVHIRVYRDREQFEQEGQYGRETTTELFGESRRRGSGQSIA